MSRLADQFFLSLYLFVDLLSVGNGTFFYQTGEYVFCTP